MAGSGEVRSHRLVLVAVDGSQHSDYALEWYAKNMHQRGEAVLALHTIEPPLIRAKEEQYESGEIFEIIEKEVTKQSHGMEERYNKMLTDLGIPGKTEVVFYSKPGEAVIEISEKENAMMIIMGTRGMGTVRRTILGSVSDYVVHHAKCPVCVCRQ